MSTHNICFHGEIRNIWVEKKNALSGAMVCAVELQWLINGGGELGGGGLG